MTQYLPLDYDDCQRLMETARNKAKGKPIGNNTRLYDETQSWRDGYAVYLHGNHIMTIHRDGWTISDGGWQTVTTKMRLNRYLPSGIYVCQRDWQWYVDVMQKRHYFHDDMFIDDEGNYILWDNRQQYLGSKVRREEIDEVVA